MTHVISPSYKSKLPKHLSYPIGFRDMAAELAAIPHDLEISFHVDESRTVEAEKRRQRGEYYPIMTARFQHVRLGISECNEMRKKGLYGPRWSVVVYAVSRQLKFIAGSLLRIEGIPKIISWLRQPRSETWLQGTREMKVYFSNKDKIVIVKESARA